MGDPHPAENSTGATEASPPPKVGQDSWWKELAIVALGLVVVVVLGVGHIPHIENFALDFQAYWNRELPQGSPQVVIVSINQEDYESDTLFRARSPLDPNR